jgi:hypothetical protein
VFCRFTLDGCDETVRESMPLPTAEPKPAVAGRLGRYDGDVAKVVARLGREGWELIAESSFTREMGQGPVLLFKRSTGTAAGPR